MTVCDRRAWSLPQGASRHGIERREIGTRASRNVVQLRRDYLMNSEFGGRGRGRFFYNILHGPLERTLLKTFEVVTSRRLLPPITPVFAGEQPKRASYDKDIRGSLCRPCPLHPVSIVRLVVRVDQRTPNHCPNVNDDAVAPIYFFQYLRRLLETAREARPIPSCARARIDNITPCSNAVFGIRQF